MNHTKTITSIIGIIILVLIIFFGLKQAQKTSSTDNPFAETLQELSDPDAVLPSEILSINQQEQPSVTNTQKTMPQATLTTSLGTIVIELDTQNTPETSANFIKLAQSGFYDGVRFHRVIKGFMIQGGDPLSKDPTKKSFWGTGGPGYQFADELSGKETYPQGTVAMANAGANTNGSQFFIVTANPAAPLPPSYTVFGKVTKGLDVALAIENVKTESPDRPITDVIIEKITISQ